MKNFDDERRTWALEDRKFMLGGEEFVARETVAPETLAMYEDRFIRLPDEDRSLTALIEITDEVLLRMIEGGDAVDGEGAALPGSARARYQALRARADVPVDLETLAKVTEWMFSTHALRPTSQSPDSSPGSGGTGENSTGTSSSPVTLEAVTA